MTSAGKLLDFSLSEEAGFPLTKDGRTFSALYPDGLCHAFVPRKMPGTLRLPGRGFFEEGNICREILW
ncbi:hypothetical protein GCWU000341_00981 [Oribacterium sp. oral taxon 078 str. F0262]|nr:hypothetical protein GCWU000341_00981 [Oribacterium sp. oral taxon 078 str. F0262]